MKNTLFEIEAECEENLGILEVLAIATKVCGLIEELQQLKKKAKAAMEDEDICAFSELEETISYYRGQICIPIDMVLGEKKEGSKQ